MCSCIYKLSHHTTYMYKWIQICTKMLLCFVMQNYVHINLGIMHHNECPLSQSAVFYTASCDGEVPVSDTRTLSVLLSTRPVLSAHLLHIITHSHVITCI